MGLNIGTGRDPVIGIVGNGFVGKAIARVFMEHGHIQIYDVLPGKSPNTFEQAVCSDIVFICVPTPMTDPDNGNFAPDMSYVHGVFKQIKDTVRFHHHPVYVIKSTVCVGETEKIATEYEMDNVVHSPEFLTARAAMIDAQTPSRNIVGVVPGNARSYECGMVLQHMYKKRFRGTPTLFTTSPTSELIKLACNAFFSMKVSFFNEIQELARANDVPWGQLIEGVLSDGRIAQAHTAVPGPDGKHGFGGACLPKDLRNLIFAGEESALTMPLARAVWTRNVEDRNRSR